MKYDFQSILIGSLSTYWTVQISELALMISWLAFKTDSFEDPAVSAIIAACVIVTVIPTIAFASLLGGCASIIFQRQSRWCYLYLAAIAISFLIWTTTNMILKYWLGEGIERLAFALLFCIPPALLGAGAMHWTIWRRTRMTRPGADAMNEDVGRAILKQLRSQYRLEWIALSLLLVFFCFTISLSVLKHHMTSQRKSTTAQRRPSWQAASWLLNQAKYEQAQGMYQELIKEKPDYHHGYSFLGKIHLINGEFAKAEECFATAYRLWPSSKNEKNLSTVRQVIENRKGSEIGGLTINATP